MGPLLRMTPGTRDAAEDFWLGGYAGSVEECWGKGIFGRLRWYPCR